ncbi:MAG: PaaI family thioesterase [Anaerolineales bacterium]|nr:PaaI family thioesterase [Anaerolineales bacterium]
MNDQPTSRMCFVCGRENPCGLHMRFTEDAEAGQVRAELSVPDVYQGYPGVVHGGIIAAMLDEVSGRAILLGGKEELMVTLRLTVRYRQPTPTNTPLVVLGWMERISGVGARVAGEVRLPDGTVTADCEAVLSHISDSFRVGWADEQPYWRVTE